MPERKSERQREIQTKHAAFSRDTPAIFREKTICKKSTNTYSGTTNCKKTIRLDRGEYQCHKKISVPEKTPDGKQPVRNLRRFGVVGRATLIPRTRSGSLFFNKIFGLMAHEGEHTNKVESFRTPSPADQTLPFVFVKGGCVTYTPGLPVCGCGFDRTSWFLAYIQSVHLHVYESTSTCPCPRDAAGFILPPGECVLFPSFVLWMNLQL